MGELIDWLVAPLVEFFGSIHAADSRSEARRLTLGCLAVMLLLIVATGISLYFWA